jgi:DNA-binding HxlR family transcriptional regulator
MNMFESPAFDRSSCPVANTLDLLGDKWSLLIIRDLFLGKQRYSEFAQSAEGIPSNILASRLKDLEAKGIISKSIYCHRPQRYQYDLTDKGKDLSPLLQAMGIWASKHIQGVQYFSRFR